MSLGKADDLSQRRVFGNYQANDAFPLQFHTK